MIPHRRKCPDCARENTVVLVRGHDHDPLVCTHCGWSAPRSKRLGLWDGIVRIAPEDATRGSARQYVGRYIDSAKAGGEVTVLLRGEVGYVTCNIKLSTEKKYPKPSDMCRDSFNQTCATEASQCHA